MIDSWQCIVLQCESSFSSASTFAILFEHLILLHLIPVFCPLRHFCLRYRKSHRDLLCYVFRRSISKASDILYNPLNNHSRLLNDMCFSIGLRCECRKNCLCSCSYVRIAPLLSLVLLLIIGSGIVYYRIQRVRIDETIPSQADI